MLEYKTITAITAGDFDKKCNELASVNNTGNIWLPYGPLVLSSRQIEAGEIESIFAQQWSRTKS